MGLDRLDESEKQVVLECLIAAVDGPFFDDDPEYHTIFGIYREDVAEVIKQWPNIDETETNVNLAINNSMGNLLGYPHRREDSWAEFISVSNEELQRIFEKWRGKA